MKIEIVSSEVLNDKTVAIQANIGTLHITTKADALTDAEREESRWKSLIDGKTLAEVKESLNEWYAIRTDYRGVTKITNFESEARLRKWINKVGLHFATTLDTSREIEDFASAFAQQGRYFVYFSVSDSPMIYVQAAPGFVKI